MAVLYVVRKTTPQGTEEKKVQKEFRRNVKANRRKLQLARAENVLEHATLNELVELQRANRLIHENGLWGKIRVIDRETMRELVARKLNENPGYAENCRMLFEGNALAG